MKRKKIPLRKCIASGEMKPKKEMIRIVRSKEGEITLDPSGKMPGRGAYISIEPVIVKKAWDKKVLDRTFETTISDDFYSDLLAYVEHQKARQELFGNG